MCQEGRVQEERQGIIGSDGEVNKDLFELHSQSVGFCIIPVSLGDEGYEDIRG